MDSLLLTYIISYVRVVFSGVDFYMLLVTAMWPWGWLRIFFNIIVCNFPQMFCYMFFHLLQVLTNAPVGVTADNKNLKNLEILCLLGRATHMYLFVQRRRRQHARFSSFGHFSGTTWVRFKRHFVYIITSMARTRMARLPWMIRTLFSVHTKFFHQLKKRNI